MNRYDVAVVGARPAGAATAMLLARRGHRVLVVDRAPRGSDTLSTHALMRAGVVQLERWGLLPRLVEAGTPAVSRVTFRYDDDAVPVDLAAPLYAPRRTVLDPIVADAAAESGADVRFGGRVSGPILDDGGRVRGIRGTDADGLPFEARATFTVGADGVRSLLARAVAAEVTQPGSVAAATLYGYWSDVETDGIEWLFTAGSSAGLIPTDGGQTLAFVAVPPARFHGEMRGDAHAAFDRVMAETSPQAAARLAVGRRPRQLRGFAGQPGWLRRPYGDGWALVGDAGYFKDPATAHGLADAMRDAELLARALDEALTGRQAAAALQEYEQVRDALSLPLFEATEAIASYRWTLDELRGHHRRASSAMKAEVRHLAGLDAVPHPAGLDAVPAAVPVAA